MYPHKREVEVCGYITEERTPGSGSGHVIKEVETWGMKPHMKRRLRHKNAREPGARFF